jgi:hypothetical protein
MSRYIAVDPTWLSIGPARRIIRILWTLTFDAQEGQKTVFSREVLDWWLTVFKEEGISKYLIEGDSGLIEPYPIRTSKAKIKENYNITHLYDKIAKDVLLVNDEIKQRVDDLLREKSPYVCIYHRGTDKIYDTVYCPADYYLEAVKRYLKEPGKKSINVFVVTDSNFFLSTIRSFRDVFSTDTLKSSTELPLHLLVNTPSKQILTDCIVDALVLSRAEYLIHSTSEMVSLALALNPELVKTDVFETFSKEAKIALDRSLSYVRFLHSKMSELAKENHTLKQRIVDLGKQ